MRPVNNTLKQLEELDFTGKGEAFVEARFVTPLLGALGYETHKDYEVFRHGDDGTSFKLNYPPVELGAVKVKHYNPDYVPAIRKKAFWIIEAKSPKDVNYPFDFMYLVQGLQCCIHPEIQAQYLVVSNGLVSSVFDAHGAVFLGQDVYTPILESRSSQVPSRWAEIYDLLGVEKLRSRIELNLNKPMTNCACRVLTRIIPAYCWNALEHLPENMRKLSQKRVNAMYVEKVKKRQG